MVYEQNVERATKAELWTQGEAVQLTWSPDHTSSFGPTIANPPGPTSRPSEPGHDRRRPMSELQPSERPGLSRRAFVQGTALAGFAAFLAACTGTKSSAAPRRRAQPRRAPARRVVGGAVRGGERRSILRADAQEHHGSAQVRPMAGLHRPGRPAADATTGVLPAGSSKTLGRLQEEVQRQGRLRGEDRRQPDLLRDDPTGAGRRAADRLGPDRPDRLDGGQDHHQGMGRAVDAENVPNCVKNLRDRAAQPDLGPEQRLPLPVAVGHDRDRLQRQDAGRQQDPRADQDRRPVEHPVRQGDLPDRVARHVRVGPAQARDRPGSGQGHGRRPPGGRRRHAAAGRQGPALHRQRVPRRTSRPRRSGRRSSGPATWRIQAARTTSSSSPRRAR